MCRSISHCRAGAFAARSILAFSKTTGFRHDSIPAARKALLDLGIERGWSVTFTEDATAFERNRLKSYDAVVFLMTTGDILNPNQKKAFTTSSMREAVTWVCIPPRTLNISGNGTGSWLAPTSSSPIQRNRTRLSRSKTPRT